MKADMITWVDLIISKSTNYSPEIWSLKLLCSWVENQKHFFILNMEIRIKLDDNKVSLLMINSYMGA